jgi:hypothetical protein
VVARLWPARRRALIEQAQAAAAAAAEGPAAGGAPLASPARSQQAAAVAPPEDEGDDTPQARCASHGPFKAWHPLAVSQQSAASRLPLGLRPQAGVAAGLSHGVQAAGAAAAAHAPRA